MKTITAISLAAATLLSSVSAQEQYTINPTTVSNGTRDQWCTSQEAECPIICLQTSGNTAATEQNTCDPTSLTYACVCSNGMSPNVSEYSQTMPYFICQEWGNQCVSNCGADSSCASACRDNHPCGAQDPTRVNSSTISSTKSASGSGTATLGAGATTGSNGATIYTGFGGAAASGTGGAAAASAGGAASVRAAALGAGQTFGLLGVMGALFGGFAVLL